MRTGGDSTKINNFLKKFSEDINISKIFFKNYLICIIFKVLRKITQLRIIKKKIESLYLNNLIKD